MSLGKFRNGAFTREELSKPLVKKKKVLRGDLTREELNNLNNPKIKQVYHQETNTFEEKPVNKKEEKQLEVLKAEPKKSDITFETLHADLLKINEKLEEKQKEIVSEDEYEFVESIETENSGGNIMLDKIRFKHTDIIIVVGNDSIGIYESAEDFDKGTEPISFIEIEESEKISIEEIKEEKL